MACLTPGYTFSRARTSAGREMRFKKWLFLFGSRHVDAVPLALLTPCRWGKNHFYGCTHPFLWVCFKIPPA